MSLGGYRWRTPFPRAVQNDPRPAISPAVLSAFAHRDVIGVIPAVPILLPAHGHIVSRFQIGCCIVLLAVDHAGIVIVSDEFSSPGIRPEFDLPGAGIHVANLSHKIVSGNSAVVSRAVNMT